MVTGLKEKHIVPCEYMIVNLIYFGVIRNGFSEEVTDKLSSKVEHLT